MQAATQPVSKATEQKIDPWDVSAGVDEEGNEKEFDYVAISKQWATKLIDEPLLERFERITGHKPHRWLRRGLFFSHRDLELILDTYERGDDFLLEPTTDDVVAAKLAERMDRPVVRL